MFLKRIKFSNLILVLSILLLIELVSSVVIKSNTNLVKFQKWNLDPAIGYVNEPGEHHLIDIGNDIFRTILEDGSRKTGKDNHFSSEILFLGDSFTIGLGLSDNETFTWKLQDKLSNTRIKNFGVGGYGTCQALLMLKRVLAQGSPNNINVVYGFSDFHAFRNVRNRVTEFELAKFSPDYREVIPFCSFDDSGNLNVSELKKFNPILIKASKSVIIDSLYKLYLLIFKKENQDKWKLTFDLIKVMKKEVESRGGKFYVFLQQVEPENMDMIKSSFSGLGVEVIDGNIPATQQDMHFYEGHPNKKANQFWADLLLEYFSRPE